MVKSSYNLFGDRLSVKQPDTVLAGETLRGVLTLYSYDHLGHLTQTSTSSELDVYIARNVKHDFPVDISRKILTQRYQYDELGRQIRNTAADGVATIVEYDLDGNVIATATQAVPGTADAEKGLLYRTLTVYDAQHQRIATRDANGNTMSWQYDHGRMISSIDMSGVSTTYVYDQAGRLAHQTSRRGQSLHYTFTGANLTRIEDQATHMVTTYAYDAAGNRILEKQQYTGTDYAQQPERMQNNVLTYDRQNRVLSITDDQYKVTYEYDANGNRMKITNKYKDGTTIVSLNDYDKMNRQTLVDVESYPDPTTGYPVLGKRGHSITYDLSGNRLSDTFIGTSVTFSGTKYVTTADWQTTETYRYDDAGRLQTVKRDGLLIDLRRYDAAGRVTMSGLPDRSGDNMNDVLKALGISSAGRIYCYDAGGHLIRQQERRANGDSMQDTYFVKDPEWQPGGNVEGGYDLMGNLLGYTIVIPHTTPGSNGRYVVRYNKFDSYKESSTTELTKGDINMSHYDANGNRFSVTKGKILTVVVEPGVEVENDGVVTVEGQVLTRVIKDTEEVLTRLWYDADGHIQSIKKGQNAAEFNLIANGQVLGVESAGDTIVLGSTYQTATSAALQAPPSSYSVQSPNETLQSIAQSVWGDAKLWYLIADANALDADAKLQVGSILRIPARVNTVHGDYGTYTPYDPSSQIGSTALEMPTPHASKGGCGALGMIVMVVIAVVATIYTAGAAAEFFGVAASTGAGAAGGLAAVGAGGIGATFSAGIGVLGGGLGLGLSTGVVAAGAIGGAAGSIASQLVGMAIGAQDGFSWKSVALSAIGGGASAGVGTQLGKAASLPGLVGRAALSNTISQGVSIVTGLQDGFNWRNVAASAAGAAAGGAASKFLNGNNAIASLFAGSEVAKASASGFVAGTTAAIVRGGKIEVARIATDSFGNALGNSLVQQMNGTSSVTTSDWRGAIEDAAWKRALTADAMSADLAGGLTAKVDVTGTNSLMWAPDGKSTYLSAGEPNYNQRIRNYTNGYTVEDENGVVFTAKDMSSIGTALNYEDGEYARWRLQKLNAEYDSPGIGHSISEAFDGWFGHKANPLRTENQEQERWDLRRIVGSYVGAHPEVLASTFSGISAAASGIFGAGAVVWGRNKAEVDRQYAYRLADAVDQGVQAFGSVHAAKQNVQALQFQGTQKVQAGGALIVKRDGRAAPASDAIEFENLKNSYRARDSGLPDLRDPVRMYGLSMKDIVARFEADGYGMRNSQTRTKSVSEVFAVEGHPEIAKIQRTENGSQHGGLYYKYTLRSGEEYKVIDPVEYGNPGQSKPGKFFAPSGQEISWDKGWRPVGQ